MTVPTGLAAMMPMDYPNRRGKDFPRGHSKRTLMNENAFAENRQGHGAHRFEARRSVFDPAALLTYPLCP